MESLQALQAVTSVICISEKEPYNSGSFAERDLQLKASYVFSPGSASSHVCHMYMSHMSHIHMSHISHMYFQRGTIGHVCHMYVVRGSPQALQSVTSVVCT